LIYFAAKNNSNHPMTVQAIPSVSPGLAARYLKKTECFCFTQQTFNPGQQRDMPVLFHIDQHLPKNINTITLAYTLFDTSGLKHAKIALQNLGRIPL
jgi:cytochrome c oxidase assembly protein subunit 11